ncbi:putative nucleotidyltransferase [Nocardia transvalensis]|uniref:Putative nucleotidyltransferase n=1 Tax=Nocardia transvalensis TaxID=37333 RepID=A0A7W9PKG2_9NOCA|nr:nucleotidyltransferase [Nocardia transvalensis]MBB5917667.1 putative nucleotidyltransferase [Nocardia transvalensis]
MEIVGLDADGFIAREGSLDRIQAPFAPVVDHACAAIEETFGPDRLHSAYLYGSVPRGSAVPGVSDLDVLLALRQEPTPPDRSDAGSLATVLDATHAVINGAGIELASTATLLSDIERHDLGWFVACLCTPLLGDDLAAYLPRYRPTAHLARETNGDLDQAVRSWRAQRGGDLTEVERLRLTRRASRRIVRSGLTLVMPRWGGWTSDLARSAEIFARYYPSRGAQMRTAATIARVPAEDPVVLDMLLDDLGPWLAAEYIRVHGTKAPRG